MWYCFRPLVGGLLAVAIYLIIRAGFMSIPITPPDKPQLPAPTGPSGPTGVSGAVRPSSATGSTGGAGAIPATGTSGPPAAREPASTGGTGATGPIASSGPSGPAAGTGPSGAAGVTGPTNPAAPTKPDQKERDVPLNPCAVVAVGLLVGLCNAKAQRKIDQIGTAFFADATVEEDHWEDGHDGDGPAVTSVTPNPVPSGDGAAIVIAGSNFDTGASVFIGELAASNVDVRSGMRIKCTLPPGLTPGSASIVVMVPGPPPRTSQPFRVTVK